jgi:serine protease Do
MDQLLRGGKVHRGKLGVTVSDLTQDLAAQFNFKGTQGALVQEVEPGQPADRAGVKAGDIITELQGRRIDDSSRLRNLVAQTAPDSNVKCKIWRDGAERELTARLTEMELKDAITGAGKGQSSPAAGALAGVSVETLTPETARRLNLSPAVRGVVVTEIDADSSAADAGLQRGDVIEEVNRQPVSNANEFDAALRKAGKGGVLLRVRRAEGARFIAVRPRE